MFAIPYKSVCNFPRYLNVGVTNRVFAKAAELRNHIELDQRNDGEDIQAVLGQITGGRTVPRVFVKGECLGGGSDVKAMYDNGKLVKYFE